ASIDSASPGPMSRSGSAMWPNVSFGATACTRFSGAGGGATRAKSLVAEPRTSTAASGTNAKAQRLVDAVRCPGFEGDIDFACMSFSSKLSSGRPCPFDVRVPSAPVVPLRAGSQFAGIAAGSAGRPLGAHGGLGARYRRPEQGAALLVPAVDCTG